ncbi:MAG: BLUF domain-containing protein [Candidatus Omnitrophica bacterium]|nr:BLUF domain-containing protein [Candidatus Omnitrophota bacterium]
MFHQLLYVSVESHPYTQQELANLLDQSRKNNQILNITGMLVYYKKHFLQILEGEKEVVLNLFQKIRKDNRHLSVILFWDEPVQERSFSDWTMAFVDLNQASYRQKLKGFSTFLKQGFGEISDKNLTTAQKLLEECKSLLS